MSSDQLNKAFQEGFRLMKQGASIPEISHELLKQGFDEAIAGEVCRDLREEQELNKVEQKKKRLYLGIGLIVLGVLVVGESLLLTGSLLYLPMGLILVGMALAISGL